MKMRGVLWGVALSCVLAQTQQGGGNCASQGNCTKGPPGSGSNTELMRPRNWSAQLGQTDTKNCDECMCTGNRTKRCNEATGNFEPERNNCQGQRWWGPWTAPRAGACEVRQGRAVIPIEQRRSCGCAGQMPAGGCWEGTGGLAIDSYQTCKGKCLCGNPECQLSTLSFKREERPAGPFFCEPQSLLPNCDANGVCSKYAVLDPSDPLHPQRRGQLGAALGQYNCPDMWPKVRVESNSAPVDVRARCGCGYKGIQTRTCMPKGCGAEWGPADRSKCIKIDWTPGCDNWGPCQPNSGSKCGRGTQRCRRTCNTGEYQDCVHAAHAGCIDPNTHLEKECFVNPPTWTQFGPWGWVRGNKFETKLDKTKTHWNQQGLFYVGPRGEDPAQNPNHATKPLCGVGKQVRFYQCSTGKRSDCLEACKNNCYTDPNQQAICGLNCCVEEVDDRTKHIVSPKTAQGNGCFPKAANKPFPSSDGYNSPANKPACQTQIIEGSPCNCEEPDKAICPDCQTKFDYSKKYQG